MTIRLRDGREGRIIATDKRGPFPIVYLAPDPVAPNCDVVVSVSRTGRFSAMGTDHPLDIVEGLP